VPAAVRVTACQRDHVRVEVLVEEQVSEVKGMADLEIGCAAAFTTPTPRSDQLRHPIAVDRHQADQLRSNLCIVADGQISTSLA
jgi:hypothetical protein